MPTHGEVLAGPVPRAERSSGLARGAAAGTGQARPALPSTTALRVFESAARHLTCTGAADELFLSQSAVSKQIRTLEESLGVTLFVRLNRGLVLTELGRAYLDEVRPILGMLRAASARLAERGSGPRTLTLRVLVTLGDRWLLPRFADFARRHPDIHVQFASFLPRGQQEQLEPDGEFRAGDGVWPGFVADYLFGRQLVLVAAPALLRRHGAIERPADLARFPKLVHFQAAQAWADFGQACGCGWAGEAAPMTRYEFYSTLIRGAVAGLGLALVPRALVHEELVRGELVNPGALEFMHRTGYYFVVPERKQHDGALAAMRAWLIEQAARTRHEHREPELAQAQAQAQAQASPRRSGC
jgi:LysR family glycine cleavage system transcriptional activator